jgi:hypothetical protein
VDEMCKRRATDETGDDRGESFRPVSANLHQCHEGERGGKWDEQEWCGLLRERLPRHRDGEADFAHPR